MLGLVVSACEEAAITGSIKVRICWNKLIAHEHLLYLARSSEVMKVETLSEQLASTKIFLLGSVFNKVTTCDLTENELWYHCFSENFTKKCNRFLKSCVSTSKFIFRKNRTPLYLNTWSNKPPTSRT